ncbi:hypothetical protein V1264_023337 [Littorina saxatilis]|uniref:Uncharacterized protein n=1 Tax=Littorina saxatilis TaxID=31220 RepID=A0AAN9B855_9CAEN
MNDYMTCQRRACKATGLRLQVRYSRISSTRREVTKGGFERRSNLLSHRKHGGPLKRQYRRSFFCTCPYLSNGVFTRTQEKDKDTP